MAAGQFVIEVTWPSSLTVSAHIEDFAGSPVFVGPVWYNEGAPLGLPRLAMCIHADKLEERLVDLDEEEA